MRKRPVVLIVEDTSSARAAFRTGLEDRYELLEAEDARRALELALGHKPDCILVELTLNGFSGLELCQILTTLRFTQNIPVIVLSSKPAAVSRELAVRHGATNYIEKPVNFEHLLLYLDNLFKSRPGERRVRERSRLRVMLRLRAGVPDGSAFETLTTTEEISPAGFTCSCTASFNNDDEVEVFAQRSRESYVGRAVVTRIEWPDRQWKKVVFSFVGKPRGWVLGEDARLPPERPTPPPLV